MGILGSVPVHRNKVNTAINWVRQIDFGFSAQIKLIFGLPWWLRVKESARQCRRHEFDHWPGKIPHANEKPSLCTTTTAEPRATTPEAECLGPVLCHKRSLRSEQSEHCDSSSPHSPQLEGAREQQQGPSTKIKFKKTLRFTLYCGPLSVQ